MAEIEGTPAMVERQARSILSRMTVDEKLAQLGSVWGYEVMGRRAFSAKKARSLVKHGIGQVTRPATSSGLLSRELVQFVNEIQRYLVEETRLGIPAMMH